MTGRGFEGRVLVVDSEETMAQAEKILVGQPIIGFDTETRPAFTKGQRYSLALLQLATESAAVLFRVQMCGLSPAIISLMQDPKVLKIGAAIRDDIRALNRVAPFAAAGFIDLQSIVGRWGIEELSVRKMAAIVLNFKVSKAQRLSNWEATKLTAAQADYAAMDAWVCREIYIQLNAKKQRNNDRA